MANLTVQVYQWDIIEQAGSNDFDMIRAFGFTSEHKRIVLEFEDFTNTVYVETPRVDTKGNPYIWKKSTMGVVVDYLDFVLGDNKPLDHEFVMMYRLYYYQDRKSPFIRLKFSTLNAARNCRNLFKKPREIKKLGREFQFNVFEVDDVPLYRKLCSRQSIKLTDWFSVFVTDVNGRLVGNSSSIRKVACSTQIHMKVFSFDIEVHSESGKFPKANDKDDDVFMISVAVQEYLKPDTLKKYSLYLGNCEYDDDVTCIQYTYQNELIEGFVELIEKEDPVIITGYNILGFDIPYLFARYNRPGHSFPTSGILPGDNTSSLIAIYNHYYGEAMHFASSGRIFLDVMHQVMTDAPKMRSYKLDYVAEVFLNEHKHGVTPDYMFDIYRKFKKGVDVKKELTIIRRYCDQDALLPIRLFDKLGFQTAVMSRSASLGVNPMSIPCGSPEQRSISLLYDAAYHRGDIVMNKRKVERRYYEGGYVSNPTKGVHRDVACLDFNSLYPSIIMSENICFTTLRNPDETMEDDLFNAVVFEQNEPRGDDKEKEVVSYTHYWVKPEVREGLMPALVRRLIAERKEAKALMATASNKLEEMVADQRQLGVKLAANTLYGFLAMQDHGRFPLIEGAMSICGTGRNSIIKCGNYMRDKYDCSVIYGDTDSIMYKYPNNPTTQEVQVMAEQHAEELTGLFKAPMRLELEKVMFMISRMKKNYAYIKANKNSVYDLTNKDLVNIKGMVPTRRDNTKFTTNVFMDILMARFNDKSMLDVFNIMLDYAKRLVDGNIPINELIISVSLSDEYKSDSAMMAVFAQEQKLRGKPLSPGRVEFYVIKTKDVTDNIGKRLRVWSPDEPLEGEIDYEYYLESMFYKPLDNLFEVLFIPQLSSIPDSSIICIGNKKAKVAEPAKAIYLAYTSKHPMSSVIEFFTYNFSRVDTRVSYVNSFFTPRASKKQ